MATTTLARLNRSIADKHVAVAKGEGYFYVHGTTPEMSMALVLLPGTEIPVYRFSELSEAQWLEAVDDVLAELAS